MSGTTGFLLCDVWAQNSAKERFLLLGFLVAASVRYAWSSLKNCVKILIGRKPFYHDHDLFFLQYVFQLTGLRPTTKISCPGLSCEGAGSQTLMIMDAIKFARSSGLAYVHTPFFFIEHAERPMREWVAAWETVFNLGAGEVTFDVERHQVGNLCYNFNDLGLCFQWRDRWDFRAAIPEFRRKYYLNKSPRTTEEVTVAVHIRRGDVGAACNSSLFTGTNTILRTITMVKSILDTYKVKYRIGVYSQGNSADFPELSLPSVELWLDVDAIWTMQELIEADVLIMAKGSFSYCAALISDGIKIFEPYRTPMDDWLPRSLDGSFDRAAFERQLFLLIQAKRRAPIGYPGEKFRAPDAETT